MKYIQLIIALSAGIILFASCEDVIILDLKDTEPRIVIEATINSSENLGTVILTETNGFYDDNLPVKIENANVSVLNESGVSFDLIETSPGIYHSTTDFSTVAGMSYELTVIVGDETYTAKAIAPEQVDLIQVDTALVTPPFGPTGSFYRMDGVWLDTEGEDNYYRLRAYKNGIRANTPYALYDDDNLNGAEFRRPIMDGFDPGTLARFELMTVDKGYFEYFLQVASNDSQGFGGSVPFNPKGNFDNNALGYFGIFTSSNIEIQL